MSWGVVLCFRGEYCVLERSASCVFGSSVCNLGVVLYVIGK